MFPNKRGKASAKASTRAKPYITSELSLQPISCVSSRELGRLDRTVEELVSKLEHGESLLNNAWFKHQPSRTGNQSKTTYQPQLPRDLATTKTGAIVMPRKLGSHCKSTIVGMLRLDSTTNQSRKAKRLPHTHWLNQSNQSKSETTIVLIQALCQAESNVDRNIS